MRQEKNSFSLSRSIFRQIFYDETGTYYLAIIYNFVPRFSENNFGFVCQRPSIYRDFIRNLVLNSAGFCREIFFFLFRNDSWQRGFALLRTSYCAAPWRSFKKNYGRPRLRLHTSQVLRSADLHHRFLATANKSNSSPFLRTLRIFLRPRYYKYAI